MSETKKAPAAQHLKELRTRFFVVAIFFILGACLAYYFQKPVIDAVLAPLKGEKLIYLNPAGGFSFIFMVSVYAGLALALPILIQQLYAFIRPALPKKAQKKSSMLIIGGFLLLIAGVAFGYFVAVPNALVFLYSFADQFIDASLTADSYLNFVIAYTLGIGIVFQIPLLLILIHSIRPLTPGGIMKSEKWVILISFIVAAIITPTPDPVNQVIIAGPVIAVYQIGVAIILTSIYKQHRATKRLTKKRAAIQQLGLKNVVEPTPAPAVQPALTPQPTLKNQPVRPQRTMDGFVRPSPQAIIVPKRAESQPTSRPTPRPASLNQRNFTIDGMYRPLQPQITTQ